MLTIPIFFPLLDKTEGLILINKILEVKEQHSHDKINSLSLRGCPPSCRRYACATRPRLQDLRFSSWNDLCHTRMKNHAIMRISVFSLKTGLTSLVQERNFVSVSGM